MKQATWFRRIIDVLGVVLAMGGRTTLPLGSVAGASRLPVVRRAPQYDARDVIGVSLASGALIFVVTGFPCAFDAQWRIEGTPADELDAGGNPGRHQMNARAEAMRQGADAAPADERFEAV